MTRTLIVRAEAEADFSGFEAVGRRAHVQHVSRTVPLTVKLRGRTQAPDWRRGRILSSGARGAEPPTRHGPLQRLLGGSVMSTTASKFPDRKYRHPNPRADEVGNQSVADEADIVTAM